MTTPWLKLFRADRTNAVLRACVRLNRRSAIWINSATEPRKAQTTMLPIRTSQATPGSKEPAWFTDESASDCARAPPHGTTIPVRQATARAGIESLLPACLALPIIDHPRIPARECLASRVGIG